MFRMLLNVFLLTWTLTSQWGFIFNIPRKVVGISRYMFHRCLSSKKLQHATHTVTLYPGVLNRLAALPISANIDSCFMCCVYSWEINDRYTARVCDGTLCAPCVYMCGQADADRHFECWRKLISLFLSNLHAFMCSTQEQVTQRRREAVNGENKLPHTKRNSCDQRGCIDFDWLLDNAII